MALRDASEVGVPDVRRFADLQVTDGSAAARPVPTPTAASERTAPLAALASLPTHVDPDPARFTASAMGLTVSADQRALLGDEELVYLQVDVPEVALQRVKLVSFELASDHRHLRRHQTILGALVWEHVDYADQRKLEDLADLIDAYHAGSWYGQPEVRRLSARMPVSLKRRVEGTVLALAHTHRAVSAKTLVAALVWRHVMFTADDEAAFARLVAGLGGYHQELSQRSLGAPVARVAPV